jgi:hypothetical protein
MDALKMDDAACTVGHTSPRPIKSKRVDSWWQDAQSTV